MDRTHTINIETLEDALDREYYEEEDIFEFSLDYDGDEYDCAIKPYKVNMNYHKAVEEDEKFFRISHFCFDMFQARRFVHYNKYMTKEYGTEDWEAAVLEEKMIPLIPQEVENV